MREFGVNLMKEHETSVFGHPWHGATTKKSAASAEASTTLTAVTVGTDQSGGLAQRPDTEPTYFGQYFGRRGGLILASGRFDDRQKFTLQ
jgi:hypothetical protein